MAEDAAEKAEKKTKKTRLEATDVEPRAEEGKLPTPHEVRTARKAGLVAWCASLGLDAEGKVDDLRTRLLERIEAEAKKEEPKRAKEEAPEEVPRKAAKPGAKAEEPPKKVHEPRLKPKLDSRTRALLALRAEKSAQRPAFRRQEWFRYKKFDEEWRKPQGGQSKLRRHFGYRWNLPSVGYRGPREVRGLHPSGFQEVLVHNPRQVEAVDPARQAVRVARGVGTRKRELIEKACDERKIRILNRVVLE